MLLPMFADEAVKRYTAVRKDFRYLEGSFIPRPARHYLGAESNVHFRTRPNCGGH